MTQGLPVGHAVNLLVSGNAITDRQDNYIFEGLLRAIRASDHYHVDIEQAHVAETVASLFFNGENAQSHT